MFIPFSVLIANSSSFHEWTSFQRMNSKSELGSGASSVSNLISAFFYFKSTSAKRKTKHFKLQNKKIDFFSRSTELDLKLLFASAGLRGRPSQIL